MKVRGPVERFLHLETSGGMVLLLAAAVALIWANSAFAHSYHALWHTPMVFDIGSVHGSVNLHFIINDVLMTIFFLLAGLEIKREIVHGELSEIRKAALPIAAAVGGMLRQRCSTSPLIHRVVRALVGAFPWQPILRSPSAYYRYSENVFQRR